MYQNSTKIQFISFTSLNVDSSFYIKDRLFKFSVVVLGIITEETVSQMFYLGPSFLFYVT